MAITFPFQEPFSCNQGRDGAAVCDTAGARQRGEPREKFIAWVYLQVVRPAGTEKARTNSAASW
ncbi:hypothetical protein [Paeniglutamicibacter psychrophenolicus]|uniref:Uncharacterized protein n=1 Tax=Paeniglutamicibacter psychrophenolicus TaxID=257454 RepID=A0ABS4WGJ2_9MICC|nr:hypothetical protein [Paeniglutamicibacter psychrophenolicus]MBP2375327.1 hypothetical protein [Paeniglutamicibacter psychrophenolicus]